jgi:hypothetical protein
MILPEAHANVATLEPFGMGKGDEQVDNEDYATYQFDPVLGAHQVSPGARKRDRYFRADQTSRPTWEQG